MERWVYECGPIDWWNGWQEINDLLGVRTEDEDNDEDEDLDEDERAWRDEVHRDYQIAQDLFRRYTSWEEDGWWHASGLPDPAQTESRCMVAVKQNNNGSVYICSPFPLVWLEKECRGKRFDVSTSQSGQVTNVRQMANPYQE